MDRKAITSYDVARLAGVSQSAVSRAFSPEASISEATRARVMIAARELGYQPNAIARSMSSARNEPQQKSGMVGLIVTRMQDPFFANTVAGVEPQHPGERLADPAFHGREPGGSRRGADHVDALQVSTELSYCRRYSAGAWPPPATPRASPSYSTTEARRNCRSVRCR